MATAMTRQALSPTLRRGPAALQFASTSLTSTSTLASTALPRSITTIAARSASAQNTKAVSQPQQRSIQTSSSPLLSAIGGFGGAPSGIPAAYFQKPSLPANTIIRFVPQQTAWIVERMGKFHRILQPGLAVLIPFLDRIAYVKSLKEAALEIPSQSAITADNVTLELDGVLYTRVFDAYKAR
jgi:hypothetical protein